MKLSKLDELPASWERLKISQCFNVVSSMQLQNKNIACKKDDIVLRSDRDDYLQFYKLEHDQEVCAKGVTIIRANGIYKTELFESILKSRSLNHTICQYIEAHRSFIINAWKTLKDIEIVIPPKDIQEEMALAIEVTSGWMDRQAINYKKKASIMSELSLALRDEILLNKMSKKEALNNIRDAMGMELATRKLISLDEHTKVVDDLREKIKTLEEKVKPSRKNSP